MRATLNLVLAHLLLLLSFESITAAEVEIANLDEPQSIAGPWQFMPGDNPSWASTTLDDSQWQPVTVPASSPQGYPGYSGIGWYRLRIQLNLQQLSQSEQLNSLGVLLGAIESAYEVYAGGQKLGGIGQFPPQGSPRYNQHGIYQIPGSAIDSQGQLVLALRVWRYEGAGSNGSSGPYQGPFLLGNAADLSRYAVESSLVPNMLMATLYFAIGLYHLFIARRNPALREFFWFGWFAIGLALYSMETSQWRYNIDLPFLWHLKLEYTVLYLLPSLGTEVLSRIAKIPLNLVMRGFKYVFLMFAVVVAIIPTIDIHYLTLPYFQYLAALWALYTAGLMGWNAYRGNRDAAVLTALLVLLLVSLINDLFVNGALLGTADTMYIVFAMTVLLMAVLMANHYTATLAKLEVSVEEHTADLLQTNQKLQEANAIKEQFLANMSHELRTPMNAILGFTHLGLQTDLSEQQRDYLTKVDASAANLRGIIDSVLDFSKLQAGELETQNQPFDLQRLLDELEITAIEQLAKRDDLTISFSSDPSIPTRVTGDATKLATVLRNLIGNAIKFTPTGSITVDSTVVQKNETSITIKFSVSDTGIGIPEDKLEGLFEGFAQADNSFSRAYGGTGLGLATAQELTRLMGGEITVDSSEGKGSSFSFSLLLPLPVEELLANDSAASETEESELDLSPIQGALILVVDDSEINLQIASEILQQAGFAVENALDGQQAVDRIHEKDFDCVLMDLQMPVMDGYKATETIRADDRFKDLPILAMTANFSPEDRLRASQAGMNAHIPKPIDPRELFENLLQWIAPGQREAVAAVAKEVDFEASSLPDVLPGLQVAEGLNRVGGNSGLYLKLLKDMAKDYLDCADKIEALQAQGDIKLASQLAHKLRGIANNLGAIEVGAICGELELCLKNNEQLADSSIAALGEKLAILEQSIDQALASEDTQQQSGTLDKAAILTLLDELEQEIADSNPDAANTSEILLQGLAEGAAGKAELQALVEALDVYDFVLAGEHFAEVRGVLR